MSSPAPTPNLAPIGLRLTARDRPTVTVVAVDGAVDDNSSVARLADGLRAAFQLRSVGAVILDLTGVAALSPRAVHVVVGAARLARQRRRELLVSGIPAQLAAIPGIHGLTGTAHGPAGGRASPVQKGSRGGEPGSPDR